MSKKIFLNILLIITLFSELNAEYRLKADPRPDEWKPLAVPTSRHSKLLSLSPPDAPAYQASNAAKIITHEFAKLASNNLHHMAPPVIEPHANGATVGLDLPHSNIRLLLDIDELASKPVAKEVGMKAVESQPKLKIVADKLQMQQQQRMGRSQYQDTNKYGDVKGRENFRNSRKKVHVTIRGQVPTAKEYDVGFIREMDLHNVIKNHVMPSHGGKNQQVPQQGHSYMFPINPKGGFSKPSYAHRFTVENPSKSSGSKGVSRNITKTNVITRIEQQKLTENFPKPKPRPATKQNIDVDDGMKFSKNDVQGKMEITQEKIEIGQEKIDSIDVENAPAPGPVDSSVDDNQRKVTDDDMQKYTDDYDDTTEVLPNLKKSNLVNAIPGTNAHQKSKLGSKDEERSAKLTEMNENTDDKTAILKPFPTTTTTTVSSFFTTESDDIERLTSTTTASPFVLNTIESTFETTERSSARSRSADLQNFPDLSSPHSQCSTSTKMITDGLLDLKQTLSQLDSDFLLKEFPELEMKLLSTIEASNFGYTLFIPSNAAIARLPKTLIEHWKRNSNELVNIILNHLVDTKQTLEELRVASVIEPRAAMAKLRIKMSDMLSFTVNGQRIIYADQLAPMNGLINVLDGILFPVANKDIMNTLKDCSRFEGFVTLIEGTGISEMLAKEGPFTVFVPTNDALQKIPDSDLERIRSNMTALKELLIYHISPGSYYSGDLRDNEFLPSLLSSSVIKTGVRVDGCSRRLVEANVSPLYRADIPASNGVIHVVDWVLKPDDNDWCEGVILPR